MNHNPTQVLAPQKNVLTLEEGKQRTKNWRNFISNVYAGNDKHMPHGFFIPFADIIELSQLQQTIREISAPPDNEVIPIYIVGVRGYYSLNNPTTPSIPVSSAEYPVDVVLVAVYQTNYREPGSPGEFSYDPGFANYDLILPVESAGTQMKAAAEEYATIYDITQPCPPLCDTTSSLFE
jgi:hypothetical protein